jgi:hypothetical protein
MCCVFAPTRSGKGVGLVVPTLLTWPGSAIVHDIKGENWSLTALSRLVDSTQRKAIHFFEGELRLIAEWLRCAGPQKVAKQSPSQTARN